MKIADSTLHSDHIVSPIELGVGGPIFHALVLSLIIIRLSY